MKPKIIPTKREVHNSIKMITEAIHTYSMDMETVFESIPDITAFDCLVFSSIALDSSEKEEITEYEISLAAKFLKKGKSLMGLLSQETIKQRNEKLLKKAE